MSKTGIKLMSIILAVTMCISCSVYAEEEVIIDNGGIGTNAPDPTESPPNSEESSSGNDETSSSSGENTEGGSENSSSEGIGEGTDEGIGEGEADNSSNGDEGEVDNSSNEGTGEGAEGSSNEGDNSSSEEGSGSSETPSTTKEPSVTSSPTQEPVSTEESEATPSPEVTNTPSVTETPEATETPSVTNTPEVPEVTSSPEVTEKPEVTVEPSIAPSESPETGTGGSNGVVESTTEPTIEPTLKPTVEPTTEPTIEPTVEPTLEPLENPLMMVNQDIVDEGTCGSSITWVLYSDGLLEIAGSGAMADYNYDGGDYAPWFSYRKSLTNVVISEGITSLGVDAFYNCSKITSVSLPSSISEIPNGCFRGNVNLTSIDLSNISKIGVGSFRSTALTSLTSYATSIGDYAFMSCPLTEVTFAAGKNAILGNTVFRDCASLTTVNFELDGVQEIKGIAFENCNNLTRVNCADIDDWVQIKFYVNETSYSGNPLANGADLYENDVLVTSYDNSSINVASGAFFNYKKIISVVCKGVGAEAFHNCSSLQSAIVGGSVGRWAFSNCKALTDLTFASGANSTIGSYAFWYNSTLKNITINASGVKEIQDSAFSGCTKIERVDCDLNDWLNISFYFYQGGIGNPLQYTAGLYSNGELVTSINDSSKVIKAYAFYGYDYITSVNCKSVGYYAFYNCKSLDTVTTTGDVGGGSFSDCKKLITATIGGNIGIGAFHSCSLLQSVNAAGSNISDDAFYFCSQLSSVVIGEKTTNISTSAFSYANKVIITVPDANTAYSAGDSGRVLLNKAGDKLVCAVNSSADIPNLTVKIIGDSAFYYSGIKNIALPSTVTTLEKHAFYNSEVKRLYIPASVQIIDYIAYTDTVYFDKAEYGTGLSDTDGVLTFGWANTIPTNAFRGLRIGSMTVNSSCETIGINAFKGCGLSSISLPEGLVNINNCAFEGNNIFKVDIPSTVTFIGPYAFNENPNLKTAGPYGGDYNYTYNSVIPQGMFAAAPQLAHVVLNAPTDANLYLFGDNTYLKTAGPNSSYDIELLYTDEFPDFMLSGATYLNYVHIPKNITSVGYDVFRNCPLLKTAGPYGGYWDDDKNKTVHYNIEYEWTEIPEYFYNNRGGTDYLTAVSIGPNVVSVDSNAFAKYAGGVVSSCVSEITVWNSEGVIAGAPWGAPDATIIYTEESDEIFKSGYCGADGDGTNVSWSLRRTGVLELTGAGNMMVYSSGSDVPWSSFKGEIKSVKIGKGVKNIGDYAFYNCTLLTSVEIADSVTTIGRSAFERCSKIKGIALPEGVKNIGDWAFYYCTGLTNIDIPNSVISIGRYAFYYCTGLTDVTLSNNLTSIGEWTFYRCVALKSIEIPSSVTSVGDSAFYYCTGLEKVYIKDLEAWCRITFDSGDANPLYYAKNLYLNGDLVTDLIIPEGILSINNYAFVYCTSLTSVEISNTVTIIGQYAFRNCSNLTSISIPEGVTSIKDYAFHYCSSLTSIGLPNTIKSIGQYTFQGCSGLISIDIPNGVTSIGGFAFRYCSKLTDVRIDKVEGQITGSRWGIPTSTVITYLRTLDYSLSSESYNPSNTPDIIVKEFDNGSVLKKTLVENTDYTVESNLNGTTLSYTVTFIGDYANLTPYSDSVVLTSFDINDCTVTILNNNTVYNGSVIVPDVSVKYNDIVITDFEVTCSETIKDAKSYQITVKGINSLTKSKVLTFVVSSKSSSGLVIDNIVNQQYTGSAIRPEPVIKDMDL